MQKFVDRAGRIWIVDIDNTTLRRVKTLTGVHLLEAIDGDLITRLSTDPLLLGDVLYAICKPQADQQQITDEAFGEGLAGNSIDDATGALLEADQLLPGVATPSSAEGGREAEADRDTGDQCDREATGRSELGRQARRRSRTQARCADIERLIVRLAGIVGVDPGPLTLRQLVLMAEAKRQHDWNVASTIMALMAEMNRDRKRRRKPFKPDDFNPTQTKSRSLLAELLSKQQRCSVLTFNQERQSRHVPSQSRRSLRRADREERPVPQGLEAAQKRLKSFGASTRLVGTKLTGLVSRQPHLWEPASQSIPVSMMRSGPLVQPPMQPARHWNRCVTKRNTWSHNQLLGQRSRFSDDRTRSSRFLSQAD